MSDQTGGVLGSITLNSSTIQNGKEKIDEKEEEQQEASTHYGALTSTRNFRKIQGGFGSQKSTCVGSPPGK